MFLLFAGNYFVENQSLQTCEDCEFVLALHRITKINIAEVPVCGKLSNSSVLFITSQDFVMNS